MYGVQKNKNNISSREMYLLTCIKRPFEKTFSVTENSTHIIVH